MLNCQINKFIDVVFMIFMLFFAANCKASDNNSFNIKKLLKDEEILSMNYWYTGTQTVLCLAKITSNDPTLRKLSFYIKNNNNLKKLYDYTTHDGLFNVFHLGYGANLLTFWTTGSAFRVIVFSFVEDKINKVLDLGTRILPEIVDVDNDGKMEILITNGRFIYDNETNIVISYPDTVDIYKWDGVQYILLGTVSWMSKFQELYKKNQTFTLKSTD